MREPLILSTLAIAAFALCPVAVAEQVEYEADDRAEVLWIPEGLETVRGLLIWGNGAGGDDRRAAQRPLLRGFCELNGFALVATAWWNNLSGGEINIWEAHLEALAELSGHPELAHAPWATLGFSNGGQMAYGFNTMRPEKVIGFVANKGGFYNDTSPGELAITTPGLLIAGEQDEDYRREVLRGLFEDNRPAGARWAWVEQQGVGHQDDDERLMLPFLDQCVQLRYPADQLPTAEAGVALLPLAEVSGWVVDPTTWSEPLTAIASWDDFSGDSSLAGWVPSPAVAWHYRAFATRAEWLELSEQGSVTARPLHILEPAFEAHLFEEPCTHPCSLRVEIDTSAQPDFGWLGVYADDLLVGEVQGSGEPAELASLEVELPGGGVWGISALVDCADGVQRTTGLRHRVVLGERPVVDKPEDTGLPDTGGSGDSAPAGDDTGGRTGPAPGCGCGSRDGAPNGLWWALLALVGRARRRD